MELSTLGRYEYKPTVFAGIDFIFTVTRILLQIFYFIKVNELIGVPYYMILDVIENLRILGITLKNFMNLCTLTY